MCESNAYVRRGSGEELLLREVVLVEPTTDGFRLRSLFGEEALVRGRLEEMNLLKHKILFREES
jgi:predicted RNA-binding protein